MTLFTNLPYFPGALRTAGGVLAALLAALAVSSHLEASAADDGVDCTDYTSCVCDATHAPSKIQPSFDASCIKSIDTVVGSPRKGCCKTAICSKRKCGWGDIKITVTPDGACKIRTVQGADTGLPVTISDPVDFEPIIASVDCEADSTPFEIQAKVGGAWKTIYRVTFHCGECTGEDPPPPSD